MIFASFLLETLWGETRGELRDELQGRIYGEKSARKPPGQAS